MKRFKVNFYPSTEDDERSKIYKCDTMEEGSNGKILFKTNCRIVGVVSTFESITEITAENIENINN